MKVISGILLFGMDILIILSIVYALKIEDLIPKIIVVLGLSLILILTNYLFIDNGDLI